MRTTLDLPAKLHQRASAYARQHGQSLSATLAHLVSIGMDALETTASVTTDPVSGFPTITVGRRVTAGEVADLIDEDA